jgi:hypothetical protein
VQWFTAHGKVDGQQDCWLSPAFVLLWAVPYAETEVTCDTPDGSVWLATFSSSAMELHFLNSSSSVLGNECAQGNGWAASIIENGDSGTAQSQAVIRALGGLSVSTNACGY